MILFDIKDITQIFASPVLECWYSNANCRILSFLLRLVILKDISSSSNKREIENDQKKGLRRKLGHVKR